MQKKKKIIRKATGRRSKQIHSSDIKFLKELYEVKSK